MSQTKDLHTVLIDPRKFNLAEQPFNLTEIFVRGCQVTNYKVELVTLSDTLT